MAQKQILIICGEASGDLNASSLVNAIKTIDPGIKFSGVGGRLLRQAGVEIYCDIRELDSIGLFDVFRKLPKFFRLKNLILKEIKTKKPDAIILVDFSGFNLRLAKAINKGIPVIYYTSPQVWASRPGRIKTIKEYVHRMIVLFGFEREFYKKYGVEADFVGHPLLDTVCPSLEKNGFLKELGLSGTKTTIALLPGSRRQEVKNILPVMLKAAAIINKAMPDTQFVIAKSSQVDLNIYSRLANDFKPDLKINEGKTYECLNISRFCLVASGTATLETAIMQKPFLIIYKMNPLNYLLYRPLIKIPYIGIVNIIAGRKIIPEFIQFKADPGKIAKQALDILKDPAEAARMENNLTQIKSLLGEKDASRKAAQIILDFLNSQGHPTC